MNLMILAAQQQPQGPEFGKASPLGLLIIIVLLIATAFLIWSMNRQLKKLPKTFDAEHPEADQAFDEGTDAPATTDSATTESGVATDERKSADT
ncbi:hypothetical protein Gbro_1640 [Gordonia bronchialis DSM 43247]|jgi:hypothetical protein|uniref:Uncharacterized protein n=1 Tax=Gordonia bronchialis (strain ATCC 25592 / DSM 43247 / BCRC 13721 / JCM 3198 / KCTC 3076 / NBRC 16047 / NCTC 10667) TaxID=526226 RepID=D0L7P7_GORB4|nr:hypothetical protein [Gordonia bronchialis]ACY20910.1 hypothetical protein Gbro_1640 [Gordonia bronchialis DSM 43247]MCC3323683.1 hypothetical protein [Gordonia bronchialis]QGS25361.1 hypothetical protein FOB84_15660 [Gordonia bronchialis]STQ63756.1 Uncharacterised protein [Gordonia bronchialis]